jgi:hypothetical protein
MEDTRQVGRLTVHVEHDPYADHPECEGMILVSFHNHFYIPNTTWSRHADFSEFIHPRHSEYEYISGSTEPSEAPVNGPSDPLWRKAYLEATTNLMEVLLVDSGEEINWDNEEGRETARHDFAERSDTAAVWKEFRTAHSEWGCWSLDVMDYGGGNIRLRLGDVFEGGVTDRWGNPKEPDGYVLVRKKDDKGNDYGWHKPLEEVARSWVSAWQSYCEGDCWMYRIVDEEGDTIESCGGYIGDMDDAMEAGVSEAEAIIRHEEKKKESA